MLYNFKHLIFKNNSKILNIDAFLVQVCASGTSWREWKVKSKELKEQSRMLQKKKKNKNKVEKRRGTRCNLGACILTNDDNDTCKKNVVGCSCGARNVGLADDKYRKVGVGTQLKVWGSTRGGGFAIGRQSCTPPCGVSGFVYPFDVVTFPRYVTLAEPFDSQSVWGGCAISHKYLYCKI